MPKYVVEGRVPDAGRLSAGELQSMSRRSVRVLQKMGPQIQWVSSIVADDTIYCTYIADSEALVRDHARAAGFPLDRVSVIHATIDPTTAEGVQAAKAVRPGSDS